MGTGHAQARSAHALSARAGAAALVDWWRLAGHDCYLGAPPRPWRRATPAAPAARHAATRSAPARPAAAPAAPPPRPAPAPPPLPGLDEVQSLAALEALVRASAPHAVFADGNPASGAMLMGEAPSARDLETRRPFTGPAGQLLDRMLAAIGRSRTSAYISLLVCRQPVPGTPHDESIAADLPIARAHIRLVRPRALLLLGAAATRALTGIDAPITRLRGTWLEVSLGDGTSVPALATTNPAYLLRAPQAKREAWADLLSFARRLAA